MRLVWKLLRENISKPQLIGFFFANLIGLTIVLMAVQFYFDVNPIFNDKNTLFRKDYFIITKKVNLLSSLALKSGNFTADEVNSLKKQDFVKDVGIFTSSQFKVFAGINAQSAGLGLNTQMFFESVPDNFMDVRSDEWHFSPSDNTIPIVLPKNYLDLYNFGFAEANSMPKISESVIGLVTLDISLVGKNRQFREMKGHIVGFSNRINTILVPESFMSWANQTFGEGTSGNPSRLIVEIEDIADPNLTNYFKEKGYEIADDNIVASKISFFLTMIVSIVSVIGIIICLLSFFILILTIYLLLEKNMSKLRTLRLIGYSKSYVVRPYEVLIFILNSIILILSLVLVFIVRNIYLEPISKIYTSVEIGFSVYTVLIGCTIFILLFLLNIFIIRKKIK